MNRETTAISLSERDRRVARIAALLVIGMGGLVMLGWMFSVPFILTGFGTMKFNVALAFVLTGVALYTLETRPGLSRGLAVVVIAIGLLTLVEYASGWTSGIDELFIRDTTGTTPLPGRMSPIAAINFCLLGMAFLLTHVHQDGPAQALSVTVAFLALLVLAGHLYGVESLYRLSANASSMAVHTSVTFIVVAQGLLSARSDRGIIRPVVANTAGGTMLRRLTPAVILIPLALGWLIVQGERQSFYDARFALALFVLANVVVFFGLTLWLAWVLHAVDNQRESAMSALRRSYDELEDKVRERTASLEEMNSRLGAEIFERSKAEKLILENENLLRLLLDHLPENIVVKDIDGRFVLVNKATLAEFGVASDQDIIGKSDFDFHERDRAEKFRADELEILRSGQPRLNYEEVVYDRGFGEERWFSTSKIPLRDDQGQMTGLVAVNHDITERRQTEAALKALHEITIELTNIDDFDEFYRRAVEAGRERLGFDQLGLLLYDAVENVASGTYGTNARGETVAEYDLHLNPAGLTSILMRALEREERFAVDEDAQLFDNLKPIGIGWNAAAVLWNGTEKLGWLATDNAVLHQPISQTLLNTLALYALTLGTLLAEKRTQDSLRRQEELYRVLVQNLPRSAVMLFDRNLRFLLANGVALVDNGYNPTDLVGKTLFETTTEDRAAPLALAYHRALDGQTVVFEWQGENQTDYLIQIVPVHKPDGKIFAGMLLMQDITDRKQAEAHRLELEVQREKVAILNQFMMDASHDFRTPITVMKSSLHLLKRISDPEKQAKYLERVGEGVEQLHILIENLFTLVRLDMKAADFEMRPGDVNTLVSIVALERRELAEQRKHTLRLNLEPDLPKIMVDMKEFVPALGNLVTNALKYTPPGGEVTIETHHNNHHVEVSVRDNGIGIPADQLTLIFNRFYRVDKARNPDTGGSGVGLTIAQKIVEAHGGQIEVESTPGAGSTFRIVLPIPGDN